MVHLKKIKASNIVVITLFVTWLLTTILLLKDTSKYIHLVIWSMLGIITVLIKPKLKFKFQSAKRIWILFLIYTLCSSILNWFLGTTNRSSHVALVLLNIYQIFIPMLVIIFATRFRIRYKFISLFKNFMFFICIAGLFEYITKIQVYKGFITLESALHNFETYGSVNATNYRLTLFFYHPIYYSVILSVFFVFLLYVPFKRKIIQYLALFFCLVNIVLTKSRTGWLILAIVLVFYGIREGAFQRHKSLMKMLLKILSATMVIIAIVYFVFPTGYELMKEIIVDRILAVEQGEATGARLANWGLMKYVVNSKVTLLFGGGSNFASSLLHFHPQIDGWKNAIDNQYLTFLLDYGIVGMMFIFIFFVSSVKKYFMSKNIHERAVVLSVISIMIASVLFDYFSSNCVFYLMIILIAMYEDKGEKRR